MKDGREVAFVGVAQASSLVQFLVVVFAAWLTGQQDAFIEYLKAENRVLKARRALAFDSCGWPVLSSNSVYKVLLSEGAAAGNVPTECDDAALRAIRLREQTQCNA